MATKALSDALQLLHGGRGRSLGMLKHQLIPTVTKASSSSAVQCAAKREPKQWCAVQAARIRATIFARQMFTCLVDYNHFQISPC